MWSLVTHVSHLRVVRHYRNVLYLTLLLLYGTVGRNDKWMVIVGKCKEKTRMTA